MALRVEDKDRGWKALVKRAKSMGRPPAVKVGIIGGGEVADVATIHEFGIGAHPERSFIRAWADQDADEHRQAEKLLAESVVKGENTTPQALDKLGLLLAASSQKFIADGRVVPATEKPGGGNTTLVDTGQLKSSITHEVES